MRKVFPIIIVVLTVAVFAISYLWMDSGSYRSVYPGMTETDLAAFEAQPPLTLMLKLIPLPVT